MNLGKFRSLLEAAQGRSEFAIVVFIDIRGFSDFSTKHDSIETAIFIKRFFQVLLDGYFSDANYVKPTGDGLLVIYNYTERNLKEISGKVLSSVLKLNVEYSSLFVDDEMVNFTVPERIGIGISRGTVCCLYSGKSIVDYSGRVVNLAARLMDMARPSGIVIDGLYQLKTIPEEMQKLFLEEYIYVRGIQEDSPLRVFYLDGHTLISENLKTPIISEQLEENKIVLKFEDLSKLVGTITVGLDKEPKYQNSMSGDVSFPHPTLTGYYKSYALTKIFYERKPKGHLAKVNISDILGLIKKDIQNGQVDVTIRVEYVPVGK